MYAPELFLCNDSPPAETKLKVFHILVKYHVSRLVFDKPSVDVETIRVEVIRRITMDSPVVSENRGAGGDEESFLWTQREATKSDRKT